MNSENLSGPLKVAILVKSLGINACGKLINTFSNTEKEKIKTLIAEMGNIQVDVSEKVAHEFIETGLQKDAGENKKLLTQKQKEDANVPEQLVRVIKDEHPQTIAIIIAHLDQNVASQVIMNLPDEIKSDVARRIAKLDKIVSGMLVEVNAVFADSLKTSNANFTKEADGIGLIAGVLNQIDAGVGGMILEELEETEPEMVEQIKQMMFVFDDLVLVDDRGLQSVLRSVETQELALALKAASEDVREKIFKNMSERASEMLKEEIDSLGAVKMKDVSDAQQKITNIIQDKEGKGEVVIAGRGGDEFVG